MDKKICFLVSSLSLEKGGVSNVVRNLVNEFDRINVSCDVLTLDSPCSNHLFHNSSNGINIFNCGTLCSNILGINLKIIAIFLARAHHYRFLHCHGFWEPCLPVLSLISWFKKIKYGITPHGMLDEIQLRKNSFAKKLYLRLFGFTFIRLATFTQFANKEESCRVPFACKSTIYISNGIPFQKFSSLCVGKKISESYSSSNHKTFKYLFAARFHPKKGLHLLLEAISLIRKENINFTLLVAGIPDNASYEQRMRHFCHERGICDSVIFLDDIIGDEFYQLLGNVDAFVLPSTQEGFSVSVIEAMAIGKPIIVSKNCNISFIEQIKSGFLFDSLSPLSVATKLCFVATLSNSELKLCGDNAKKWAYKECSISNVVSKLLYQYKS